jgi:14-3-3 protein beta/theta/zeta
LREICDELLQLLDNFLIAKAEDPDSKIFYAKMKGDYYRYLAEIASGDERQCKPLICFFGLLICFK